MKIKRGEVIDAEELMAIFGSPPPPENEFDLSAEVVLSELTDDELLFRESIIKSFFEKATRSGHPIYGFTIETLERMHAEVVKEFQARGRDYAPKLDRHKSVEEKDFSRGINDVVNSKEFKEAVKREVEGTRIDPVPWITATNQPYTITYNVTGGEAHDKKG